MNTCPKGAPPDDVTVMAAVPLFPSLVALIVMEPGVTPLTRPLLLTVATAVLELDHVTVRPESGAPFASFGVAVSGTVWPACPDAEGGVTSTVATGTFVTVTDDVPLFPSLVAVIVAEPGVTPETSPLLLTVATAVLELDHVTVRPESGAPFASFGVAVSGTVWPACPDAEGGVTSTVATGTFVTVTDEVPLLPSLVAVIVAEPGVTPETRPLLLTVATAGLELDHVTVRPESGVPPASLGVAVSCTVWPACTDAEGGVTSTVATGTFVTVTDEVPLFPSLVAVIVADPGVTPETSPLLLTAATAVLELDHVTVRPESGFPPASFGVAVSCTVWPACTDAEGGVTSTVATGTFVTVIDEVPLFPSLVAVIVAEPGVTPETRPLLFTAATAVLELDNVTVRPERGAPLASFGVAVSCTVWPACTEAEGGVTSTVAMGAFV